MTNKVNNNLLHAQDLVRKGSYAKATILLKSILEETSPSLSARDVYEKAVDLQNKLNQKAKLKKIELF